MAVEPKSLDPYRYHPFHVTPVERIQSPMYSKSIARVYRTGHFNFSLLTLPANDATLTDGRMCLNHQNNRRSIIGQR